MQRYRYTAVNLQKQKIKGVFLAQNEADLAEQLAKQHLFLVRAKLDAPVLRIMGVGKVNARELTGFCRQFSLMLNTGIPILDCLDLLRHQQNSETFRGILQAVYEDVKSGHMLSDAFGNHPAVFPDFFRSMVHVGEASGQLNAVFTSLADYYEKLAQQKQKIRSAMAYPGMLTVLTIGILILMLTWVVPTFQDAMQDMQVEVTGITKAVYDASDFVLNHWRILLAGVFGGCLFFAVLFQWESARYFWDGMKLKVPFLGKVQRNLIAARFARALGLLLSSGMDLNAAMDAVEIVMTNRVMKRRFHFAAQSIRQGMSLTVAFEAYRLFPVTMVQLVAIGEKTAALDEVLLRSAAFLDGQVEQFFQTFTAKIQPVMLLILGTVIALLFLAMYAPLLSIMSSL